MDVVLHYEDEYLLDWVYQKVSPGVRGAVALSLAPLAVLPCLPAGPGDGLMAAKARELSPLMASSPSLGPAVLRGRMRQL